MRVLSSAGSLQHGLSVSAAIADELHAFTTDQQVETWTALWTALHKRDDAFALVITTSGFNKDTLLGRTYDASLEMEEVPNDNPCLRIHRDIENGVLFWWYGIPEHLAHDWRNEELWRQANPASWIRIPELRQQLNAPTADELDFQRLHLNMWTASRESWLPTGAWAGLLAKEGDEGSDEWFPRGSKIYVGVDVGWHHDSTACVWATRLKNGKIAIRAKVWTTLLDQLGDRVPGGTMKLELVERFILETLKAERGYKIAEVAYDPAYFGRSAELLERKGLRLVEMPPQHNAVTEGWNTFYAHAVEQVLSHNGDPILTAHVEAAGVEMTNRGPRVRKTKSTSRIDALAAAVLAVARCDLKTRPGRSKPGIFWMDLDS
jgi:phage terminase large subunit-like protein